MFCPNCGSDNSGERRYCSSCGTNLEIVSKALSGTRTDLFTKIDSGLDQFVARYSEHIFPGAPANAAERKVSNSWKLLGQGLLTSITDLLLAFLMLNVFSLRFNILLISSPVRLLSERIKRQREKKALAEKSRNQLPEAPLSQVNHWLPGSVPTVSEHTTEHLQDYQPPRRRVSKTEP
jgi:hypothetical protein